MRLTDNCKVGGNSSGPSSPVGFVSHIAAGVAVSSAKATIVFTSRTSAKLVIDVTPTRLAQEQAQERGGQRQGRAGGERARVRLERVDARPARDGPRPARVQDRTERPLRERGAQKAPEIHEDRKSTRLNSSHGYFSYAVSCWMK